MPHQTQPRKERQIHEETPAVPGTASPAGRTVARPRRRWGAQDLALVAVFAALVAASVAVPGIPVGPLGVPITLQTLAVGLCALVLGFGRGTAAVALYVLLGAAGLPIFSLFRGGPGVLAGPSGGYLIGFIAATAVAGLIAGYGVRRRGRAWWLAAAAVAGMLVDHAFGAGWFIIIGKSWGAAVAADAIYFPGDILKCAVAVAAALSLHRAFPDLLQRRR
ncbi:MAG: biotin transporter BioY [Actinomycetales bacterium]|jgi:biotin transport system substrate-specific component